MRKMLIGLLTLACAGAGAAQSPAVQAKWDAVPRTDPALLPNLQALNLLAVGVIMYENDFHRLPDDLKALAPDYLKVLPDCPLAGGHYVLSGTYPGFKVSCSTASNPDGAGLAWAGYSGSTLLAFNRDLETDPMIRVHVNASLDLPLLIPFSH